MIVWLVGILNCETTDVRYVCLSETTALKRWEELRLELIKDYKNTMDNRNSKNQISIGDVEMYGRILANLAETDPTKLENYPHEEPFIHGMVCEP